MKQYLSPNAQFLLPQTGDILTISISIGDGKTVYSEEFGIQALNP